MKVTLTDIQHYYDQGILIKEIACIYNVSPGNIRRILKRHKMSLRKLKNSINPSETLKAVNNNTQHVDPTVSKGDGNISHLNNAERPTVYTQNKSLCYAGMMV